ncbi:MAG: ABC transporter ATP-binding protein [Actinomycetota bacterium]
MRLLNLLLAVLSEDYGSHLRRFVTAEIIAAAISGIGFVLLVPTLDALLEGDTGQATQWLLAMVVVLVAWAIVAYWSKAKGFYVGSTVSRALHRRVGNHVVQLPLGWFEPAKLGTMGVLASRGVVDVMGVPAHLARALVVAVVTPLTVVLAMFAFEWRLALAALATLPALALTARLTGWLVGRADHRSHHAQAEATSRVVEFSTHQPVLRAFGRSIEGDERLEAALTEQRDAGRALLVSAVPGFIGFLVAVQLSFAAIFIVGVVLALGGEIEVALLVALLVLAARFVEPLIIAADLMGALRIAENSLDRFSELLADEPLPEPASPQIPASNALAFSSVRFGYQPDTPVLTDVSFTADQGTVTALVGPSGSGKTTITRLIARFWDVDAGSVTIGDVDVRMITTEQLMARLSLVFQDVYLFEGTIMENIRLGRPGATDLEVIEAAAAAQVTEIVDRLPDGWYSQVGEGGTNLSGGERQRVSIARAILKDAPIVLLDEATAALDPANETLVSEALRALAADKTVLVIAHRLSTVQNADQILVLDGGRIVETGTHDELIGIDDGRYRSFWERRASAAGWRLTDADAAPVS